MSARRLRVLAALTVLVVTTVAGAGLARKPGRLRGSGYEGPDPCARLTPALVQATFDVAPDVEIASRRGSFAKEVCTLTWRKPNATELEEKMKRQLLENTRARAKAMQEGKEPPPIQVIRTDSEVTLNYGRELYKTDAEARVAFEGALRLLQEGVSSTARIKKGDGQVEERTATFQADHVPVSGVGDAASWAPKLNQLAVLDGKGFFYIVATFDDDDEENRERAVRLAKKLVSGQGGRPAS